ncbi:MAG: DUF4373 domain-containing protein [Fibrobacter sp.]|nr:DUF4373 domain-containing protein [Fibrobacter sp.]
MDNVLRMRMQEGAAGYGIYVMILECLRSTDDYRIKSDTAVIGWQIHEQDLALVERVITQYDLFDLSSDGYLSSPWLNACMADHEAKRAKLSAAGRKSALIKSQKSNQAATTLTGGGQPRSNDVSDLAQQPTTHLNNHTDNLTPSDHNSGAGVEGYFSAAMISKIGKDKSGLADVDKCRISLVKDPDHNPDIIISRILEYKLTYNQVMALYNVTEGCLVGGARTVALLAAFRHCKETQFRPMYAYEYLISRIKDAQDVQLEISSADKP